MRIIFNTQIYTKPNNYSNKNSQISYKARPTKEELDEIRKYLGAEYKRIKQEGYNARIKLAFEYMQKGATDEQIASEFGISEEKVKIF